MRVYTATVPEHPGERTLEAYLRHALCLLPAFVLRDAFRRKDVQSDGARPRPDDPPVPGSTVRVYTDWQAALPVVWEDNRLIIINKPAGISCDDDGRGGMTVLSVMTDAADGRYVPRLAHRLDNQTSGLLILSKTDEAESVAGR